MKKIIVGISAADGVEIGLRLLKLMKEVPDLESHLVVSRSGEKNLRLQCAVEPERLAEMADYCYDSEDMAAPIASGSFVTEGMIVAPCSMKTLAAIANGYGDNLLVRAADVCLKERRRLVLMPREMPLGINHIRNMLSAAECGCSIVPPMLTFYNGSRTIEDMVDHALGKAMLQFGICLPGFKSWKGSENNWR